MVMNELKELEFIVTVLCNKFEYYPWCVKLNVIM